MPSRVGQLVPSGASNSVSGLVFLLNHTTIYIRDFQFDVVGRGEVFIPKLCLINMSADL